VQDSVAEFLLPLDVIHLGQTCTYLKEILLSPPSKFQILRHRDVVQYLGRYVGALVRALPGDPQRLSLDMRSRLQNEKVRPDHPIWTADLRFHRCGRPRVSNHKYFRIRIDLVALLYSFSVFEHNHPQSAVLLSRYSCNISLKFHEASYLLNPREDTLLPHPPPLLRSSADWQRDIFYREYPLDESWKDSLASLISAYLLSPNDREFCSSSGIGTPLMK